MLSGLHHKSTETPNSGESIKLAIVLDSNRIAPLLPPHQSVIRAVPQHSPHPKGRKLV